MQYLSSPTLDKHEQRFLFKRFGKFFSPLGTVRLSNSDLIQATGLDYILLDGEWLVMEPVTASWVFLSNREVSFLKELKEGEYLPWLQERWPRDADASVEEFISCLFRRGIVSINKEKSVDPTIFQDSPNVEEGNLVEILLTEKCNLGCGYCLAGASPQMPTMNHETASKTVDLAFSMEEANSFTFEFSGGEPFLKFDLLKSTVDYIHNHPNRKSRSVYLAVQTNGTLLDEERVKWLKDHNIEVGLSIDGNPESHNVSRPQINGKESFYKVLAGLDLLQRHEIEVGVLIVLNRSNIHSVHEMVDFLADNGLSSIKLNPVVFLGAARETWEEVGLDQAEAINYFQTFAKLIVERNHEIIEANLLDMIRHLISKQRASRCLRGYCGAGETFQTISANGDIFPCGRATQSPGMKLGNVFEENGSLSAPASTNAVIQEIKKRRPDTLEGCHVCSYRELCQAGCSAQAFEKYGTVRHRTPECEYFKSMYPFLMRWLSFDTKALDFFNRRYFGLNNEKVELLGYPFLPD